MRTLGVALPAFCLCLALSAPASSQQSFEPRATPGKMSLAEMRVLNADSRVIVKFREGSDVRLRDGRLAAPRSAQLLPFLNFLRDEGISAGEVRRLHRPPEEALDAERQQAQRESGRQLADLNLYYIINLPPSKNAADVADRLNRLPIVEFAEPQLRPTPLPVDIAPATPDFTGSQGYKADPPSGIGTLPPRIAGANGLGVRVADIEYSWQLNHEDLELPASARIDTGNAADPFNDTNHGTAVLGQVGGRRNDYGVTGIVSRAKLRVAASNTSDFGFSVARAITQSAMELRRGDVMLIEQQAPVCGGACGGNQVGCGPVEYAQAEYDAISAATAKGIIVVEAAGNGAVDLDAATCNGRFNRTVRDSRAIIVGAGNSADRSRLSFSSYGSRVDVQGWGNNIATTGYGDAFDPGDVRQRYTAQFGGTSGASPIVAGAVASIQGVLRASGAMVASPREMRRALVATGTPQTNPGSGLIGPLPNVRRALKRIQAN